MNLNSFEKTQQEKITAAETLDGSEAYFAQAEVSRIKQKIEKRKTRQKRIITLFAVFTVIIAVLLIVVGYSQYKLYKLSQEESVVIDGTKQSAKTGEEVITALKRHIVLPSGVPQIAEVKDVEKLRNTQAFFKDAENGDIVVVYNTTIILYRPSLDLVVAMGDMSGVGQQKP